MADRLRDFWIRKTGTGQQVAQLHDQYMMMMMMIVMMSVVRLSVVRLHVLLSGCITSASTGRIFMKFGITIIYEHLSRKYNLLKIFMFR